MKSLHFSGYALSAGIATALLSGCGALPLSQRALSGVEGPAPAAKGAPCIYLLSTNRVSNLSNAQIRARRCYIYINDTANMSYSTITAAKILYSGSAPKEEGAKFPEATPAPTPPAPAVSDPCRTIPGCSYLTQKPPATSGCSAGNFNGNGQTIGTAGSVTCFSMLTISGQNEVVCGLIEITGSQLHLNASSITSCSSGVTFAMSSNTDDTNFSSATLTLSAPQTGKYKDVLFYRDASQNAGVDFSTCRCNFAGVLYFPTTAVDYSGSGCNYQLLIFGQANISTSSRLCIRPPHNGVASTSTVAERKPRWRVASSEVPRA